MTHCSHIYKSFNNEVCVKCGALIITRDNYSIKPKRYDYLVEFDPKIIFKSLREKEINFKNLESNSAYLNQRKQLIKLLNHLILKLKFRSQTFYLSIYCLDLLVLQITDTSVFYNNYQLLAIGVLLVVSKFDENDSYIPNLSYFSDYRDHEISIKANIDNIRNIEIKSLMLLNYEFNYQTPYHFLNFFCAHGLVFAEENIKSRRKSHEEDIDLFHNFCEKVYEISKDALFSFIDCEASLEYSSIQIACSCVCVGREARKLKEIWHFKLADYYQIKYSDFEVCFADVKHNYLRKKKLDSEYKPISKKPTTINYINETKKVNIPNKPQTVIENKEKVQLALSKYLEEKDNNAFHIPAKKMNESNNFDFEQKDKNHLKINYGYTSSLSSNLNLNMGSNITSKNPQKIFEKIQIDDFIKKNKNKSAKGKLNFNSNKNVVSLISNNFNNANLEKSSQNVFSHRFGDFTLQNLPKIRNPYSRELSSHKEREFTSNKNLKKADKIQIYSVNMNQRFTNDSNAYSSNNYNQNLNFKDNDNYFQSKFTSMKEIPSVNPILYIGNMIANSHQK